MNPKKETYKKLADTIIKNLNKRNMRFGQEYFDAFKEYETLFMKED